MKAVKFHASPVLAVKLPAWRSRVVLAGLFVAFVALLSRAIWVQVYSKDFYQKEGEQRWVATIETLATRGKITDRNGADLASSIPAFAVYAQTQEINATAAQVAQVAQLLDLPVTEVEKKIDDPVRRYVYLKRQVSEKTAKAIDELRIPGIHQRKEYRREYPQGGLTAHVVGYTNVDDRGQEGIELAWQDQLAGQGGTRRVIRDRMGHAVEDVANVRVPKDGTDLVLSLDAKIQYLAATELAKSVEANRAAAGAVVVLDVRTGEILALANLPTYDPNHRAKLSGEQLRNRVLTDTYEPGSTLKPFTIALALEHGYVKPDTVVQTAPGRLTIGNATITDAHAHGALSIEEVIKVSSNVGTAKVGLRMKKQEMWEMFTAVGLGQAPRWGFPGAAAGRVRPFAKWQEIEQATMSYGYGLSVSLIQIARAYSIFARDGEIVPLTFFKPRTDADASAESVRGTRVISVETARKMRRMLEMATGPGGTAPKAQVMGYRVAGKTGTAYKLIGGKYAKDRYIGSFVGFAPASDPRIVVAVMIDDPRGALHYGGDVAAPVFSAVVAGTLPKLNIEPDAPFKSRIVPVDGPRESL